MEQISDSSSTILSSVSPEMFIGRESELERILKHAAESEKGLLILAAPAAGLSELLRQSFDRLFRTQTEIVPVYFSFSDEKVSPESVARRFLQCFVQQFVAFRRRDEGLLKISPDICELCELAYPADLVWMKNLIAACERESHLKDARSFVRQAFSAPLRAAQNGVRVAVFFDDFHNIENTFGDVNLLSEIKEIFSHSTVPFVFAGRRRYVLNAVQTGSTKLSEFETLNLKNLSDSEAGKLIEILAEKKSVEITEQARDLIIRQFYANPALIGAIISAAREKGGDLKDFHQVQKVYVESLMGGKIGKYYDSLLDAATENPEIQKKICALLASDTRRTPIESWRGRFKLTEDEFYKIVRRLNIQEIIHLNSAAAEISKENTILRDYLETRYRLETVGEQRALVIGTLLSESLKLAPQTMAKFYRRSAALGLREIMAVFNCQKIPASLLNYALFPEKHKGAEEAEILHNAEAETEKINLPQVVYTASGVAFYPPISQFSDEERTAVGIGFETGNYTSENEVVWIAAEIDSKLEAGRDLTEFWCDRLEMVALMCNFLNYRLWLIAPEGFTPEACEILEQRNAVGSSRRQIEILLKFINAENLTKEKLRANEYEMIVPMGDDTEMISAHALEEIARRHSFAPKTITQIKTALVEACINAAEHSLSPDRKIYQRFIVEDDKIVITISNRGVKIPSVKVAESVTQIEPGEGRRGWGLKLIRNLMDEVNFEQVDDGTRISMVKYLKK